MIYQYWFIKYNIIMENVNTMGNSVWGIWEFSIIFTIFL